MSIEKIINEWKEKQTKPLYWFEGEESFFIDQLINYAEHYILTDAEKEFNQTIFYGKDAEWTTIINACRRYPMFSEKQVVILKEAQHMRDVEKLEQYIENPLPSTILLIGFKEKSIDGRKKFGRLLKQKAEFLSFKKLYDNQLPEWTMTMVKSKGYDITQQAVRLIIDHLGNDLSRIENEVEKVWLNLGASHIIDEDAIEKYIGISKEFNVFELQDAVGKKDFSKAIRIIQFFASNPKAAPIQLVLPSLYGFFSKVYSLHSIQGLNEKSAATALGVSPFFVKDYLVAYKNYSMASLEKILLLLHQYNLRSVGVNDVGTDDAELLKELAMKIMYN